MSASHCCICGAQLASRYARVDDVQSGESFALLVCPSCGLGVTDPAPTQPSHYYGQAYWGKRHGFTARFRTWRRLRLLERRLRPGARLLDVGCGEGEFLVAAARRGLRVVGTELEQISEHASREGVEMHRSLDELDPGAPFDAVTLWHALEHLPTPVCEIDRIADLLVEGGTLIVAVPDFGGAQARIFGRCWFHLDVPRHLFHFTRSSLLALLTRRGLVVEQIHYHEFEYDLFGWLQSALNAILPTPNVFYGWLTGKPAQGSALEIATSIAVAVVLTPFAFAATALGSLFGRGATLRVIARKRSAEVEPRA